MNIPTQLKYTENDEWIRVDGNIGSIGITDFAQEQLSDIVFIEILISEGDVVKKCDACATVESVKAAADVYLPVSGKVVEINEALTDTPEVINKDPYSGAWIVRIELNDLAELEGLLDATAYEKHCQEKGQ